MSSFKRGQIKVLLVSACVGLFGCGHQPPRELVMAREAYQHASNGPAMAVKPDEVASG